MTTTNTAPLSKRRELPPASRRERGETCLPPFDKKLYRQRHEIENMFARLKDWKRIHTRYDPIADTFMAAITIAAICPFCSN